MSLKKGDKFAVKKDQMFLLKKGDQVWVNDPTPSVSGRVFVGPILQGKGEPGNSARAVYVDPSDLEPIEG